MFRSLQRRLTLLCTLVTGVILIAVVLVCLAFSQQQLTAKHEAVFQGNVNAILFHIRSQPVLDHVWLSQTEAGGHLMLQVELSGVPLRYGGQNQPQREALFSLASSMALQNYDLDLTAPPESNLQTRSVQFELRDSAGARFRAAAATIPLNQGWAGIIVINPMAREQRELGWQRLAFALFTLVALGLLALFAWAFTRRALRPIEEARRKQTEFVAAASHELRSPLAVIHASLSALPGSTPEQAEHFTELADGECMRMSRLVGDMLCLANADNGAWTVQPSQVELETLLLTIYEGFESRARERGIRLEPVLPDDPLPRCPCDRERLAQVLSILVDNALSYTPQGGRVRLGVTRLPGGFSLTVADTGPGIPDAQKGRIFERFYRADPSRTSREHYGLGLSIAREIVHLHRGTLSVSDTPGGGATFTITLPER